MRTTDISTWFLFENIGDEEPTHEGNIFPTPDGGARVEWSHVDVGLVVSRDFPTVADAQQWLIDGGYVAL